MSSYKTFIYVLSVVLSRAIVPRRARENYIRMAVIGIQKKCKNLVAFYPKLTGCSSWMMEGLKNLGNLRIIPGILLPTGSKQV